MKKFIFSFILMFNLFCNCEVFSQTNYNVKLVAHIHDHFDYTSSCWGYVHEGREYAIYGWYSGTSVVDITDSSRIHEIAFAEGLPSGWREMKTYHNYLYVVSEADNSGIQIFDLSYLPDSIHLIRTFTFPGYRRAHTISASGHYLYVNGGNYGNGGIAVLDIGNDPTLPVKLGEWEGDYVHDCRIVNDTIWACNPISGNISIINSFDKNNLQYVTNWHNGSYPVPHNCALSADNKYIFVTDENFVNLGKIKIWDITDKNNVILVNEWAVPGTTHSVHNVEIYGNYGFVAYYGEGIRILDITSPVFPKQIGWYKTTGCWAVYYFNSGKIIASDIYDGLYVLKLQNPIGINQISSNIPGKFSLSQNYPNPFNPSTVIRFQVAGERFVKLIVYDALGKEVSTLVKEQLKPGEYEADFDGTNLPSGVYYYQLVVGDNTNNGGFSETKKMVLIK